MSGVITNREPHASVGRGAPRDDTEPHASARNVPNEAQTLVLDEFSVSQLRQFFELLDEWDRKSADTECNAVPNSTKVRGAAGGA